MTVTKTAIILATVAAGAMFAAPVQAKTARCVIKSDGGTYRGPCRYSAQRGGTFTVKPVGRRTILPGVMMVTVFVDRDGYASVSGLTARESIHAGARRRDRVAIRHAGSATAFRSARTDKGAIARRP